MIWRRFETGSVAKMQAGMRAGRWLGGCAALALAMSASAAAAQDAPVPADKQASDQSGDQSGDIVVTGSRIPRSRTETAMPVTVIDSQVIADRGYVTVAQALNTEPGINPQINQTIGDGSSSGPGIQSPSLFGLGTGRTLTLVNGRRMVTTSSGLSDPQVDSNIIPIGLLKRVEVVQGGGAAVYGSDAIAGVVNYVLRKDFTGVEGDVQGGVTSRGDYPNYSARLTAGTNFAEGRGNIAVDLGWSSVGFLPYGSRPATQSDRVTVRNPADTGPNDGISSRLSITDGRFWTDNFNGIIFSRDAPATRYLLNRQFAPDGSVIPFNQGTTYGFFASGGDGLRYQDLVGGLRTGVDRVTGNLLAHYDLTDRITLSTELLFARTHAREGMQIWSNSTLGDDSIGQASIYFTKNNAFLTPAAITALSALSPSFAAGGTLNVSKDWRGHDLLQNDDRITNTNTYRALLSLDGKFDLIGREMNWTVSGSYARVDSSQRSWGIILSRFTNALDARRNAAGQIVCAINADASTANDDPACAPINFFGSGNVSQAARNYINTPTGRDYRNEQVDILASVNGSLFTLPAGDLKYALTYEHRDERSVYTPLAATASGILAGGVTDTAAAGHYYTNEFAVEGLLPIVGGDFTLPLVRALELSGAFRFVDNSLAGKENVWNIGARWQPVRDVTFRASRSRNFRAPSITALNSPASTSVGAGGPDPCDAREIDNGPNPTQRHAACLALFQANPTYGTGGADGAPAGSSAAARLAAFQNAGYNFTNVLITTKGNPNLHNEVSNTWTYGIVFEPHFIPGLSVTADRIEINLTDGFSPFTTEDFADACYDNPNPPAGACQAFTRVTTPTASVQAGSWATGTNMVFNAGIIRYRGETYAANYRLPLRRLFANSGAVLDLSVSATHTAMLKASVTGDVFTDYANVSYNSLTGSPQPSWSGRADVTLTTGPLRLTYEAFYLGPTRAGANATVENSIQPRIASNTTHSLSAQIEMKGYAFRFGVSNLTDRQPSFPTLYYGDLIGRAFFAGAKFRF